jgi:hypothetical protein
LALVGNARQGRRKQSKASEVEQPSLAFAYFFRRSKEEEEGCRVSTNISRTHSLSKRFSSSCSFELFIF